MRVSVNCERKNYGILPEGFVSKQKKDDPNYVLGKQCNKERYSTVTQGHYLFRNILLIQQLKFKLEVR